MQTVTLPTSPVKSSDLPDFGSQLGSITKSVNKSFQPVYFTGFSSLPKALTKAEKQAEKKLQKKLSSGRLDRWAMQAAAGDILPKQRVAKCLCQISTFKHPNASNMHTVFEADYLKKVQIQHSPKKNAFYYSNLMTCGSVWHCPVCAAKISEERKLELETGVNRWRSSGCEVLLLTLTIPHYIADSLKSSLSGISLALKKMTNSTAFKILTKDIRLHGRIRALEVTYGQNGWHPHFHLLLFLSQKQDKAMDLPVLTFKLLKLWKRACKKSCLPAPNWHGVRVDDGRYAAKYVGKWGLEAEMTKGHIKKSNKGFSPFDLLRNYLEITEPAFNLSGGKTASAALFQEYSKEFKGKRQLVWSRGLRDDLLGDVEKTDQELSELVDSDAYLFASIPLDIWRIILRRKARGVVLEKCRQGVDSFHKFIEGLEIHTLPTDFTRSQEVKHEVI